MPDPEWLIEGVLGVGMTAEIYGQYATAKSFVALDWACSVASGCKWLGRAVKSGPALFIAAEGGYGQRNRLRAWKKEHDGFSPDIDFIPDPVSMRSKVHVDYLCELIAARQYRIVVIDTLTTTAAGWNQDSATDMGQYVDAMNRLRSAAKGAGAAVVVVHHAGYDKSHGRGSTALPSGVDAVIQITGADPLTSIEMHCDKIKDAPIFGDIYFFIAVVDVVGGTSCVVREKEILTITPSGQDAKRQSQLAEIIRSQGRPVTPGEVADEIGIRVETVRSAFRRGASGEKPVFIRLDDGTYDLAVGLRKGRPVGRPGRKLRAVGRPRAL